MFKDKANPIGVVHKIEQVEEKLVHYARMWDEINHSRNFWNSSKINLSRITNFLLFALDDFITIVSAVAIPGPDKKATVLDAIDKLYEYTVKEAMPIWLKPFAGILKNYIVYVVISNAIDWIVLKYQSNWKTENKIHAWDGKFVPCLCRGGKK